jgi:hypothetical protein
MPVLPPSYDELNRRGTEFWQAESVNPLRRASDPSLLAQAMEDLEFESKRTVPVHNRQTLELALARAEERKGRIKNEVRREVRAEDGRLGGRPPRGDALQTFIEEIVAEKPNIKISSLLDRIRSEELGGVIEEVDSREIHFKHGDFGSRSAPIAGLKDRLARARKSQKSRKPVSANP